MKRTSPLFLSRGWGEFEWERDKLGKREKGEDSEWGKPKKKVFNTSIKRFWGFIKLGRGKFEIRNSKSWAGNFIQGLSWSKFHQVFSFTENIKVVLFNYFHLY